ncbi:MAG: endo-1,4-beta-xylanase [Roseburia sp.]
MKKWKLGTCIALCATMLFSGIGTLIPENYGTVEVYAETVNEDAAGKTFTAEQLSVVWSNANYLFENNQWKMIFENQYDQIVWRLPETINLAECSSVTFQVEDQTIPITLKLWSGEQELDSNTKYGLSGQTEYTFVPSGQTADGIGIMITDENPVDASVCLNSVTFEMKGAPSIELDIPDWKDSITSALGENTIAGTAIMSSEIGDETLMSLVEKHFNAVTFGNELKPDALFNYQLDHSVNTKTIIFDGQELLVPVVNEQGESLDFSRADAMAEKILTWNQQHPDQKIRIRGHVLVWHSQTQEWFFHENYDISQPYVDKDTMNRRLEWFISSVFEHYFGDAAQGKYDGLFYGWDVVNEAVIGNDYRTDKVSEAESLNEIRHGNNSSWWHVYQSNEFIINAFKYANKYAPADVELYYNDFGEIDNTKCEGIVKLIKDVKSAEGTRLDAFGMQAHYSVDGFSAEQFKTAAEKYIKAAGKVQLTELDFQSSSSYDGTDATKESEYTKIAYCHKKLFDVMKELNADGMENVTGLTVWGVIEPNSWLHSQSGVGGGADGAKKQCPLLFDGYYKAKPAYWAYVDASKLKPSIQKITVTEKKGSTVSGKEYCFSQNGTEVVFIPVWDKDGIMVQIKVNDAEKEENDAVTVYVDVNNEARDLVPLKATVKRKDARETENGYVAEVFIPLEGLSVAKVIGMDVVVTNADKIASFNDLTNSQETSSKYYAQAVMKPAEEEIPYGTASIDGERDTVWDKAVEIPLTINLGAHVSAVAEVLWDEENLYVYAKVKDAVLNNASGDEYQQDSLEVFIDENNHKSASYEDDDKQYRISYVNKQSFNGKKCLEENIKSAAVQQEDGYVIEAAFRWTDMVPYENMEIGLEFQINDADDSGKRVGTLSWNDETGMGWSRPDVFGSVKLIKEAEEEESQTTPIPGENQEENKSQYEVTIKEEDQDKIPLTEEEKKLIAEGKKKDIKFTVKEPAEDTVEETVRKKISDKIREEFSPNAKVGMYLDINLIKQIGEYDPVSVTQTNGEVAVSIRLPENLKQNAAEIERTYKVVRVHENTEGQQEVELLHGEYNKEDGTLTFWSDKFSLFAIAYEDQRIENSKTENSPEKIVSNNNSTKLGDTKTNTSVTNEMSKESPKTADDTSVAGEIILLGAGILVMAYAWKKKYKDIVVRKRG